MTLPKRNPFNFTLPENFTMPKLSDIKLENGMTALEFAKALMTGTISSNTADTNTPDKGLSDVQSGALNINPFVDGAAMSNALTLAGRDATANSRGIVFGLVGTGRSSNEATALGMTGAKASTDTFVINGGGLNQNAMGSNLAVTPQGPADTSVRSAAFNIAGGVTTGGLTNAVGKKAADSAGLAAGMTGLGDSYSSLFSNSLTEGDASSNAGLIAGTLTGASKGTVGSLATSAKRSAESQALATSKSAIGSSTSKSASMSTAAQNATSKVGSDAFSGVGNAASISSTTASGLRADAAADSKAHSEAGAANSFAISKAQGVTSASAASNATSQPSAKGIRRAPVLLTQLRLPSLTLSSSKSSSSTFQPKDKNGAAPNFLPAIPSFLNQQTAASRSLPTTLPLLGEALASTVGLKMLLPSTPRIIPQLPTLNQTIEVQAAPACNETEINMNRTANETRLSCNATLNATSGNTSDPTASLPGLRFFDNLKAMRDKFDAENKENATASSPSPDDLPASNFQRRAAQKASSAKEWFKKASAESGGGAGNSGGSSSSSSSSNGGQAASGSGQGDGEAKTGDGKGNGSTGSGGSSGSATKPSGAFEVSPVLPRRKTNQP
ncbi:hypothetical protein OEZ86_008889 [Tetradesmus obliquus]|nr:hypothetical protein OEZ86_008889 [Tetradesmus obliquus]